MRWPWQPAQQQKVNPAGTVIAGFDVGRPVWTSRNYEALANEAFVRNAIAYKCVKMIATSAAMAPWLLAGRDGAEIETHPLLDLLNRPAPMIGGHALFEAFYAYLMLSGNGYLLAETVGRNRPPKELWTLRPDRTRVIGGRYGTPSAYEYEANGLRRTFEVDPLTGAGDILHLKEFHPTNDWYGLGRVEPAAYAVDRHSAASAHNKALLDNSARPSGALIFMPVKGEGGSEQSAPPSVIEAATKELNSRHGGSTNAGKPFVFGGNVKWEEMGLSPRDMDFAVGKDDAARDICAAFGVPHLLVVPGSATYSNMAEAKLDLWEQTILPLLDLTLDGLNAWLVPRFGDGLQLSIDLDAVSALEPRRESKRKSTVELVTAGILSPDEAREALQYEPRPAQDVQKADAATLSALVAAVETMGHEPLFRYLISVGLLPPDTTLEQFALDAAAQFGSPDDAEDAILPVPALPAPVAADDDTELNGDAQ